MTIEVQRVNELDGGSLMGFMAKGKHDPWEFSTEICIDHDMLINTEAVEYRWFRWTPAVWFDSPPPMCLLDAKPHSRGAFLATYYAVDIHGVSKVPAAWHPNWSSRVADTTVSGYSVHGPLIDPPGRWCPACYEADRMLADDPNMEVPFD